jgi:hypothetical protein
MSYHDLLARELDLKMKHEIPGEKGKLLKGQVWNADLITVQKNPRVIIQGKYIADIVKSKHPADSERSNALFSQLVNNERISVTVKIIGDKGKGHDYLAVCYEGPELRVDEAHEVLKSDRVVYAVCTDRRIRKREFSSIDCCFEETEIRMTGYKTDGTPVFGFLKGSNCRQRPIWEDYVDQSELRGEEFETYRLIMGFEKHSYHGIQVGERMIVRLVGDNSHKQKDTVTYFMEPVITLRTGDKAKRDFRDLMTCVTDSDLHNSKTLDRGNYVHDIVITRDFETDRLGTVGVGYVRRPEGEHTDSPTRLSYLKPLWVIGGAGDRLIESAAIQSNPGVVIATKQ